MTPYSSMTRQALEAELTAVRARYAQLQALHLKLNMARGKPGKTQLDMVSDIFDVLLKPGGLRRATAWTSATTVSCTVCPAAKRYFADILGCQAGAVPSWAATPACSLMYDTISKAYTHGLLHSRAALGQGGQELKWLCPVPGL